MGGSRRCRADRRLSALQAFVGFLVMPEDLSSAVSLNGVVMNSARRSARPSRAC